MLACTAQAPPSPEPAVAAAVAGDDCGPDAPCEVWLVCVDGRCTERRWPEPASGPATTAPGATDPGVVSADVDDTGMATAGDAGEVAGDADSAGPDRDVVLLDGVDAPEAAVPDSDAGEGASDAPGGLDAPPDNAGDAQADDAKEGDADSQLDAGPDTSDATADADADADADAGNTGPPPLPDKVVFLIAEDDPDLPPGEAFISLSEGQAWVAGLTLEQPGELIGIQLQLGDAFGSASCGMFRPIAWVPLADGSYWPEPSWEAPEALPMVTTPTPQVFLLAVPEPLPASKLRLGLRFEGPCTGDPPVPVLVSDSSGDTSRTWLWAPEAEGAPWVPAGAFGVEGRWILRALVEVVWSPTP